MYMYQWVLEVYFRMGRKKGLHSANPTRIRQAKISSKVVHPLSFKDNSKGHIRTKYTGMTCNGVGVILPRRWWVVVHVPKSKCVVGLSISFWLYCLLKSLWFEQLHWCFYVICLYFAWDERHFFYCFDARGRKERSVVIETSDVF